MKKPIGFVDNYKQNINLYRNEDGSLVIHMIDKDNMLISILNKEQASKIKEWLNEDN